MRIALEQRGEAVVLAVRGPLIGEEADRLRKRIAKTLEQGADPLVLDVSGVPFLDSQGLELLVDTTERLIRTGKALRICGANELLAEVFDLTEVAPMLEQFGDVEAAVGSAQ
ncbi:MAG: STAS domain-containing protein [Phycisphaerae bacterium]